MPQRPYRVAVIGRTRRGDYGHSMDQVWKDLGGVEVVALADEDAEGAKAAAARAGAAKTYSDYREMLAREKPEFVTVGPRWMGCHREMLLACIEAGTHIYLEKPLVPTPAEADEVVAACERKGVKLAIAHHLRYVPAVLRAKQMIAEGAIGDVLEVRGSGKEDARGGGEDLMLLGSHILDLFRFLTGDAAWCFARVTQGGKPATRADVHPGNEEIGPIAGDRIDATYGFTNSPALGHFTSAKDAGKSVRFGVRVLGTKGALAFEPAAPPDKVWWLDDPKWTRPSKAWQPVNVPADETATRLASAHWLQVANVRAAADLIEAVEQGRQPRCGLYDARATLEMILSTYESHRSGGAVELPLKNREHPLAKW